MSTRTSQGRLDLMAQGSFEIDPETGHVLAGEVAGEGLPGKNSILLRVRYEKDAKLDLSVPIEASEAYWRMGKPGEDRLEVKSTYSAFRRFEVSVGEQAKAPKDPRSPRP